MTHQGPRPLPRRVADTLVGRTLATDVLHRLRADLLDGVLPPGKRLRFHDLRLHYAVSFGTLREALAHLTCEGFVESEGQRGFRVTPLTLSDLIDIGETRILLERRCLSLALQRGGGAWRDRVCGMVYALGTTVEAPGPALDGSLEPGPAEIFDGLIDTLAEGSGSPVLLELRGRVRGRWNRYRQVLGRHMGSDWIAQVDLAALGAAVQVQDEAASLELLEACLRDALRAMVIALDGRRIDAASGDAGLRTSRQLVAR